MIKLYNYDKRSNILLRIIEVEFLPDKYEFCSLTPLSEEHLDIFLNKKKECYIVFNAKKEKAGVYPYEVINKPIVEEIQGVLEELTDIEKEKKIKIDLIVQETSLINKKRWGTELEQTNILCGITDCSEEIRLNCIEFLKNINNQGKQFQKEVKALKDLQAVRDYTFKFKY